MAEPVIIGNATLYLGDCLETLKAMPDESVNCCVTSPPYFGLRDYGHDGQIGLEPTPDEYVAKLVEVFREVRRVLKKDGTCWLNLGDSYASGGRATRDTDDKLPNRGMDTRPVDPAWLKPKDLIGIPWRVAFALQADGWYLRQDIIWHKPNPMPESVTDRCTKAHEYLFLLSKEERYWYHADAIKDPVTHSTVERLNQPTLMQQMGSARVPGKTNGNMKAVGNTATRNRRSVWTIPTQPYSGAHFAVYPPDLVKPCLLAGCPEGGTVLDPFNGSGTTGAVALQLGRHYIGIELNPDYLDLAHQRLKPIADQPDLFTEPAPPTPTSSPEQTLLSFELATNH